jgi:acetolactate synthase-1/2/3 large subunit
LKNTDLIANFIHHIGVKTVPVFQGGNILHLIDSIAKHPHLNIICPLHEQSLSMIVETQARLTGYGVGVVTSGPGATNITTGVADAYFDSIPCMFIAGQVGMHHLKRNRFIRQRGFQETDTVDLFTPITKFSTRIERAEDTLFVLKKAYEISISDRPGPVFIELPYNVQTEFVDSFAPFNAISSLFSRFKSHDFNYDLNKIVQILTDSKRPVFVMGGGVLISNQSLSAYSLVNLTKIPVVVTWPAVGIYSHENNEYFGTIGRSGHMAAQEILEHADLIICIGTRLNSKVINEKSFGKKSHVIVIDIDESELYQGLIDYRTKISADLRSFLPALINEIKKLNFKVSDSWLKAYSELKTNFYQKNNASNSPTYVNPEFFFSEISSLLKSNCRIILDTGCNLTWSFRGIKPKQGQRFISAFGHSPMGFSLPAIIGAYLSNNEQQIFAVIGDGGFQINIQELQTIVNCDINVIIVIVNNKCLGNTKFPSINLLDGRSYGNDFKSGYSTPNFENIVRAYGIDFISVSSDLDVAQILKEITLRSGPIVVELNVDPDLCPEDNW